MGYFLSKNGSTCLLIISRLFLLGISKGLFVYLALKVVVMTNLHSIYPLTISLYFDCCYLGSWFCSKWFIKLSNEYRLFNFITKIVDALISCACSPKIGYWTRNYKLRGTELVENWERNSPNEIGEAMEVAVFSHLTKDLRTVPGNSLQFLVEAGRAFETF